VYEKPRNQDPAGRSWLRILGGGPEPVSQDSTGVANAWDAGDNRLMPDRTRSNEHDAPAECFTGLAGAYARHRPSYPRAAIEAMLDGLGDAVRAVDVGCGTGISTRLLAQSGATVIGIDPNEDMLDQARNETPTDLAVRYVQADAEATGLAAESADLLVCAQSFHWFDPDTALAEFHRLLAPGGRLALMWNVRTNKPGFTAGYNDIARRAQDDAQRRGLPVRRARHHETDYRSLFTNEHTLRYPNPQPLDWPALLGRAASASYYPRTGAFREQLDRELRALFDAYQHDGVVSLEQETELTLAEVIKSAAGDRSGSRTSVD
jgi:SAM-dependent methyltransferase